MGLQFSVPWENEYRETMYGTLGFVNQGRRNVTRDPNFLGATGHPARRDMFGARPAEPHVTNSINSMNSMTASETSMGPANTLALLERRCIFLEEQNKRRSAEVADLRAKLAESRVETVSGTVEVTTLQAAEISPEVVHTSEVAKGSVLALQYPMKRILNGKATQVWMQRRMVDPDLATVSYAWVLIFEEQEGEPDRVFVGDYK